MLFDYEHEQEQKGEWEFAGCYPANPA